MKPRLQKELLEKARHLRKNPTQAEKRIWEKLRNRRMCGIKFKRQHPIGRYIVDFYSHEAGLVIEIDGDQHGYEDQEKYDTQRTVELERYGLYVMRFCNDQVIGELEGVLEKIRQVLQS